MPVVDPHAWQSMLFGDQNALVGFLGEHELWHRALDAVARAMTPAKPYPNLPLGDGWNDAAGSQPLWHAAHQAQHVGLAVALGIASPPDLESYDLSKRDDFASWAWLHARESVRIRQAAGV